MPLITKKGMPTFPAQGTQDEINKWFHDLQLRLPSFRSTQVAVDLPSIDASSWHEATVTVNGITTNHAVVVNPPTTLTAGLYFVSARVSAANTLKLLFLNSTGSPIDESEATYTIIAIER